MGNFPAIARDHRSKERRDKMNTPVPVFLSGDATAAMVRRAPRPALLIDAPHLPRGAELFRRGQQGSYYAG